eukprot:scaffold10484_cov31-Tisochrysis_lutea.AAC.5
MPVSRSTGRAPARAEPMAGRAGRRGDRGEACNCARLIDVCEGDGCVGTSDRGCLRHWVDVKRVACNPVLAPGQKNASNSPRVGCGGRSPRGRDVAQSSGQPLGHGGEYPDPLPMKLQRTRMQGRDLGDIGRRTRMYKGIAQ